MLSLSEVMDLPNSDDHREHKNTCEEIYSLFEIEKRNLLNEYINKKEELENQKIALVSKLEGFGLHLKKPRQ